MCRMPLAVTHHPETSRFEARLGDAPGQLALCSYRRMGDTLVLHHTEVPWALQGRGIAGELVQSVLDWARAQGLRVRPSCSYVAAYMRRHPETHDLLEHPGDTP
jgi:predicted GNAT family acetyltransferase